MVVWSRLNLNFVRSHHDIQIKKYAPSVLNNLIIYVVKYVDNSSNNDNNNDKDDNNDNDDDNLIMIMIMIL